MEVSEHSQRVGVVYETLNLNFEDELAHHIRLLQLLLVDHLHRHHHAQTLLTNQKDIAEASLAKLLTDFEAVDSYRLRL